MFFSPLPFLITVRTKVDDKLPLGAVGILTATQKIRTGLQQLMAGSRNFNLSTITRGELMSLTGECESVTGIPYVMRA